jgi:hypothetical protein
MTDGDAIDAGGPKQPLISRFNYSMMTVMLTTFIITKFTEAIVKYKTGENLTYFFLSLSTLMFLLTYPIDVIIRYIPDSGLGFNDFLRWLFLLSLTNMLTILIQLVTMSDSYTGYSPLIAFFIYGSELLLGFGIFMLYYNSYKLWTKWNINFF